MQWRSVGGGPKYHLASPPKKKEKVKSDYIKKNACISRICCAEISFSVVKSVMNYNRNCKFFSPGD